VQIAYVIEDWRSAQLRKSGCRSIPLGITPQHTTEARAPTFNSIWLLTRDPDCLTNPRAGHPFRVAEILETALETSERPQGVSEGEANVDAQKEVLLGFHRPASRPSPLANDCEED
jgi:hypothetical protein